MNRSILAILFLCAPLLSGCATEREYLLNNRPFWSTVEFVGGFFESAGSTSPFDEVKYSTGKPANVRQLNRGQQAVHYY
jgi:hypothetical protein